MAGDATYVQRVNEDRGRIHQVSAILVNRVVIIDFFIEQSIFRKSHQIICVNSQWLRSGSENI